MKILMLAPEPFFTFRGTPFSIFNRLKALSELGHEVDLVTYHLGEDVSFPGLTIHRIPRLPFVRHVKVGPSLTKVPLDLLLFSKAGLMCLRNRYDCVHTHEEAALMGALLRVFFGMIHVYDMHSSLPQQFVNYDWFRSCSRPLLAAARFLERFILAHADAVIAICPHLVELARAGGARGRLELIENPPLVHPRPRTDAELARRLRLFLGLGDRPVALYTGTFEYNQGLEEIVRGIPLAAAEVPEIAFVLVGGEPHQVEAIRALGERLGVSRHLFLPGKRPVEEMNDYMAAADILLSFRKVGTNTPLKIYSYLWSGTPTVATDLLVHTQVLDREVAVLTEPTADAFARGVVTLARDPALRRRLGENGRALAERRYSPAVYLERMRELFNAVQGMVQGAVSVLLACAFVSPFLAEGVQAFEELASLI